VNKAVRETDYIKAWALFLLGLWAGYYVAGLVGGLTGFFIGNVGGSTHVIKLASGAGGLMVAIVGSYLSFRFTVSKIILRRFLDRAS
jgi:high-affinity Fe2+/Pb2+ permease